MLFERLILKLNWHLRTYVHTYIGTCVYVHVRECVLYQLVDISPDIVPCIILMIKDVHLSTKVMLHKCCHSKQLGFFAVFASCFYHYTVDLRISTIIINVNIKYKINTYFIMGLS